jgi:hypothetical protein
MSACETWNERLTALTSSSLALACQSAYTYLAQEFLGEFAG